MFKDLAAAFLGDVMRASEPPTEAEVQTVYQRGRAPDWLGINTILMRDFKAQAAPAKPFFNHDHANTDGKFAA